MAISSFIERIFSKDKSAKSVAKDRLRLVLMQDRASIPGHILEQMRKDILLVVSRYLEIDESALDLSLDKSDGSVALTANIPIKRVLPEATAAPLK